MSENKTSNAITHKGKVKWFNKEKGYGYITNNENKDLYFGVKDVIGAELPELGDLVSFKEYVGKEGTSAATKVKITNRATPTLKKVKCEDCHREVTPTVWYYGGSDYTTVNIDLLCPFCGYRISKKGGGFNRLAKTILTLFVFAVAFVVYKIL